MAAPCYCCPPQKRKVQLEERMIPNEMDLDVALHELGMLSTVTNSRKEYLREKMRAKSAPLATNSLCVVQMNSKFVTNFSFSKSCSVSVETDSEEKTDSPPFQFEEILSDMGTTLKHRKMIRSRKRYQFCKPYHFPWRTKLEESLVNMNIASPPVKETTSAAASLTRQDSGSNKSNPGSPVKSQKTVSNAGCSIFRSRSLDDTEFSKLNLLDGCSNEAGRAEIDTVSQRISKLHVS